jgi:hypothetical protein
VSEPGPRFRVTATAADGIVEAIASAEFKPIMGVQWHPEWMGQEGQPLFRWLVNQAHNFYVAKKLHERILTLDTHCDTPMFFPQGVRFEQRDNRILYDLHKMTEGRQDAVIMVAYLPQPKMGEAVLAEGRHCGHHQPQPRPAGPLATALAVAVCRPHLRQAGAYRRAEQSVYQHCAHACRPLRGQAQGPQVDSCLA